MRSVPMWLCLSILASSWARTTTRRARSVKRSKIVRRLAPLSRTWPLTQGTGRDRSGWSSRAADELVLPTR